MVWIKHYVRPDYVYVSKIEEIRIVGNELQVNGVKKEYPSHQIACDKLEWILKKMSKKKDYVIDEKDLDYEGDDNSI